MIKSDIMLNYFEARNLMKTNHFDILVSYHSKIVEKCRKNDCRNEY